MSGQQDDSDEDRFGRQDVRRSSKFVIVAAAVVFVLVYFFR
jgi:hypothetical protein